MQYLGLDHPKQAPPSTRAVQATWGQYPNGEEPWGIAPQHCAIAAQVMMSSKGHNVYEGYHVAEGEVIQALQRNALKQASWDAAQKQLLETDASYVIKPFPLRFAQLEPQSGFDSTAVRR